MLETIVRNTISTVVLTIEIINRVIKQPVASVEMKIYYHDVKEKVVRQRRFVIIKSNEKRTDIKAVKSERR